MDFDADDTTFGTPWMPLRTVAALDYTTDGEVGVINGRFVSGTTSDNFTVNAHTIQLGYIRLGQPR